MGRVYVQGLGFTGLLEQLVLIYSLLRNFFYFYSYKTQENITNIIYIMVLRGV